jgi:sugar O-acyltransferase (sialic acid O-acetyltransferase NeuD family)
LPTINLFGAASDYVLELVETCTRLGQDYVEIFNLDSADSLNETTRQTKLSNSMSVMVAQAYPQSRAEAVGKAIEMGAQRFINLVDPTAVVAKSVSFGCGSYINSAVVIGSKSQIGCHVNLNRAAVLGHHVVLEDFVAVGPGAILCGGSHVGTGSFIAAGAVVLPKVKIGENSTIGAGAVVTKDVPASSVVFGNPARFIKKNPQWKELSRCPVC